MIANALYADQFAGPAFGSLSLELLLFSGSFVVQVRQSMRRSDRCKTLQNFAPISFTVSARFNATKVG